MVEEKVLQVRRKELKYPINLIQYSQLVNLMSGILIPDKFNGNYGYFVRSLYFDSYADTDFYDKMDGVENRKKIRLRTYSHDSQYIKLELKKKYGDSQCKQSLSISREDANKLISGNYDVLLNYKQEIAKTLFYLMKTNNLHPTVLIEYNRKAFIHPVNDIRITLDSSIKSNETDFRFFEKDPVLSPINDDCFALLEVKYNGFLFGWLKELLNQFDLNRESYSKYTDSRRLFEQNLL